MAISIIDGEVVEAVKRATPMPGVMFAKTRWKKADGSEEKFNSYAASEAIAENVKDGASGRYFVSKSFSGRQMFGYRGGGKSLYHWSNQGVFGGLLALAIGGGVTIYDFIEQGGGFIAWPLLALLGIIALIFDFAGRQSARRAFDAAGTD